MAEQESMGQAEVHDDNEKEVCPKANYKPPAAKTVQEIIQQDEEDESLRKYKELLLGPGFKEGMMAEGKNPKKVIFKKLVVIVKDGPEMEMDLTLPKEQLEQTKVVLKEGSQYRVKVIFSVQGDSVMGLKYKQKAIKKPFTDKEKHMLGCYGPKCEDQCCLTAWEEAPSGILCRGDYEIHSQFKDDDKNIYMQWKWHMSIKKDFV